MKPWWRKEIDKARASADLAEQQQQYAVRRRQLAESADVRAKEVEKQLRNELSRNGFADALRAAFGGIA